MVPVKVGLGCFACLSKLHHAVKTLEAPSRGVLACAGGPAGSDMSAPFKLTAADRAVVLGSLLRMIVRGAVNISIMNDPDMRYRVVLEVVRREVTARTHGPRHPSRGCVDFSHHGFQSKSG